MADNTPLSAKRGNSLGIKFFHWALKIFGLNRPCEFVWAVCLYYLIFDREAVKAAMPYIRHRFPGAGWLKRQWYAYRIFVSHGQSMLICTATVIGYKVSIIFKNREPVKEYLDKNSGGFIIVTSHFGNWQTAMPDLQQDVNRPISFLMRPEQNEAVHRALQHNPELKDMQIISTTGEMGGMLEVMEAVKVGRVVCIMTDRAVNKRTSAVEFLGETAYFPYAAFFLGAELNCPVLPLFVAKDKKKNDVMRISFGNFIYPSLDGEGKTGEILSKYVREYVAELENKVREYPFQCYLFQDVWNFKS